MDFKLGPLAIPEYVKSEIKRRITVDNEEQAVVAADALRQWGKPIFKLGDKSSPEFEKERWIAFFKNLDLKGWKFLLELSIEHRRLK